MNKTQTQNGFLQLHFILTCIKPAYKNIKYMCNKSKYLLKSYGSYIVKKLKQIIGSYSKKYFNSYF